MYDEISCLTLLNVCTYHMQSLVYTLFLSFCLQRWTGPAPPAVAHSQLDCVESGWQVSWQKGVLSVWVSHEPWGKLGSFLTNAIFLRPVHCLLFHEVKHYIRQKLNQPTKVLSADLLLHGCLFHSQLTRKANPSREGSKQGVTFHFRNLMKCKMMIWL